VNPTESCDEQYSGHLQSVSAAYMLNVYAL